MGYKLPDWKKSIGQNTYDVDMGDESFTVPKVEYLLGSQVQALSASDDVDGGIYTVLDEIAPGLGAAFVGVPVKYLKEFMSDWQGDSGITLGESEASSN